MNAIVPAPPRPVVPLDPTARLQAALTDFESVLSIDQNQHFHAQVQQYNQRRPDASSVIQFVAQIDAFNHGKTRTSVSSRLCAFLDATRQFSDVVGTFVSSNPMIAALVWGGIKTAILVASNITSYFDKVTSMMMMIGNVCPIYRDFSHLYSSSTALEKALCDYYAIVVRFSTRVIQISQRTVVNSILSAVISPFESEFKPFQDELAESSRIVKLQISLAAKQAAQASTKVLQQENREQVRYRRFARKLASEIRAEHDAAQQLRIHESNRRSAEMRLHVKDQLSTINQMTPWKQAQRQRLINTAEWFRGESGFQAWEADPYTATLWCPGRMGSGKTILVSSIIAHLHMSLRAGDAVAFHFCRSDNSASLSARNILGTLARQLLDEYIKTVHGAQLQNLRDACEDIATADIVDLLLNHLPRSKRYYIIVDGLDESPPDQITELATNVTQILKLPDGNIKLLFSGRPELEQQLFRETSPKYRLPLARAMVNADVERYVNTELDECLRKQEIKLVNPETILEIRDILLAGHDGLILFVRLLIEELCMLGNENAILKALAHPPKKISDLLATKMRRVQDHDLAEDALKVLRYCGCMKRPLTVDEFSELLSLSTSQTSLDRTKIPQNMDRIIAACCGLIYVENEEEMTIHYVHHSVKDWLFVKSDTQPEGFVASEIDIHLGCLCLTYLSFNDFKRQLRKVNAFSNIPVAPIEIGLSSAQTYSSTISEIARRLLKARRPAQTLTTSELARKTEDILCETDSSRLGMELQSRSFCFLDYVQEHWICHSSSFEESSQMWHRFLAYAHGANGLAKRPWVQQTDGQQNGEEEPPTFVAWALTHNHPALLLYEISRDPCRLSFDEKRDILEHAIISENRALVLALLDHKHCTADLVQLGLLIASHHRRENLLEIFVHAGAGVNAISVTPSEWFPSFEGRTPLRAAAEAGSVEMVERLVALATDAIVDYLQIGLTALELAISRGHLNVVERLLAVGQNYPVNRDHTLYFAAERGYVTGIEQLVLAGGDVNATFRAADMERRPLQAAALRGHVVVVERLLAAGANVHVADHVGCTALLLAADNGHLDVVKRLLTAGAHVNHIDCTKRTALLYAAGRGRPDMVKWLLKARANPDAVDISEWTALHLAAEQGHDAVVKRLLRARANVHAVNSDRRTALHLAAEKGYHDVTSRLLAAGANPDAIDNSRRTALDLAADQGHDVVVGLFAVPPTTAQEAPLSIKYL